jgi:hypothetical protein
MSSRVTAIPAAEPNLAARHFESHLTFETDCWDVHASMTDGKDFVLLDVRSAASQATSHMRSVCRMPRSMKPPWRATPRPPCRLLRGPHCNETPGGDPSRETWGSQLD